MIRPSLFLSLFVASLIASLALSGCQSSGNVTLRAVSADDRIDRYQLSPNAHVPSVVGGVFPGDSDIVGSKLRNTAAAAPRQSTTTTAAPATSNRSHKVKKGETLRSIARIYGTSHKELAALNGLSNPNQIGIGQTLLIPWWCYW